MSLAYGIWKLLISAKNCLLQGFANIYFYYAVDPDEGEDMRKHIIFEILRFMENIAILLVARIVKMDGKLEYFLHNATGGFFIFFILSLSLKTIFYFYFHPWSMLMRNDLLSWFKNGCSVENQRSCRVCTWGCSKSKIDLVEEIQEDPFFNPTLLWKESVNKIEKMNAFINKASLGESTQNIRIGRPTSQRPTSLKSALFNPSENNFLKPHENNFRGPSRNSTRRGAVFKPTILA